MRIEPRAFLSGSVDLLAHLGELRRRDRGATVRAMQGRIAAHAHRLVYGLDRVPGDAIEVFLGALYAWQQRRAEQQAVRKLRC